MTVQLFEASAAYQVLVLAAALDSGAFPPADRRILLLSRNSAVPEVEPRIEEDPALRPALARFDDIAVLNDLIHPLHPKAFRPRVEEQPLFRRAFRRELGIGEDERIELALESIQTPPARSLLNVFTDSPATVYAEGLMSYGPTRDPLSGAMWSRIDRVLHLDLVPGLKPVLLSEYGVPTEAVDAEAFRGVVRELAAATPPAPVGEPYALLLGQYLAALKLTNAATEARMYGDLIAVAAARGLRTVLYKPHPSAPPVYRQALERRAQREGVRLLVSGEQSPAELRYEADPPSLVLGCFSTGLVTATRYWSIPAVSTGTSEVLASLPLFEDSNRVPLVLVDRTVPKALVDKEGARVEPAADGPGDVAALQRLVLTVAYCMQWRSRRAFRADAAAHLKDPAAAVRRYVPQRRLRDLMLPGGSPVTLAPAAFERLQELLVLARAGQVRIRKALGRLVPGRREAILNVEV